MTCSRYADRTEMLEDYACGSLAAPQATEVRLHLESCAECRAAVHGAGVTGHLLRAAFAPAAAPAGAFWTRLRAELEEQESRLLQAGDFWGTFEQLAWRLSFGAAALAVLLLGIVIGTQLPRLPVETTQAESRDIFQEPVRQPANGDEVLLELAAGRSRAGGKR